MLFAPGPGAKKDGCHKTNCLSHTPGKSNHVAPSLNLFHSGRLSSQAKNSIPLVLHCASLLRKIFASLARERTKRKGPSKRGHIGCFPLCQRFRKFRSQFKWKGSFRFLLTGIFGITSGGGPHISVGIFRPKFA